MTVQDPNTGISFVEMMVNDRIGELISEKYDSIAFLEKGAADAIIESTNALKRFCNTYQTLTTDQDKYVFYIREYKGFVKHLDQLYNNVQKLYKNDTIYRELQDSYPEHIATLERMLGSLYVQRCIFDNNVRLKMDTIIARGDRTAADLVHKSVCPVNDKNEISDTNQAAPLTAWPTAPRDPESYEVKTMPTEPSIRLEDALCPDEPQYSYVNNAQEIPEHMEDPGYMAEPVQPFEVPHPGPAPALDWGEHVQGLYDAYLEGLIVQRPEFEQSQLITLKASTNKSISLDANERYYFIHFYNTDDQGTYLGHSIGV